MEITRKLLVVSGPSGVGKGTLLNHTRAKFPQTFGFSVSHTSRKPRDGESDGREYFFVSREQFQRMIDGGEFLEFAEVHGNFYGTSLMEVTRICDEGRLPLLEIDLKGAQQIQDGNFGSNSNFIFVEAPSFEALEARLCGRGSENPETMKRRMETARNEMEVASKMKFHCRIVNGDLEQAKAKMQAELRLLYPSFFQSKEDEEK